MTKEEAIKILYEMLSKTAYSGELGGLAVKMAVDALSGEEYKPLVVMCYDTISEYRNDSLGDATIRELERVLKNYPTPY